MKYIIDIPNDSINKYVSLRDKESFVVPITVGLDSSLCFNTGLKLKPYPEPDKNVKNNDVHLCNSCVSNIPNIPDCPALEENVLCGDCEDFDNVCCCSCYIPKNYYEPESKERKAIEDEVWEFASMLMRMHPDIAEDIYLSMNGGKGIGVAAEMTYQEAKAKYEAWKKRDEIRVGDEVEYTSCDETMRFVVTGIVGERAYGFNHTCEYGDAGGYCDIDMLRKTGRHFDEVEELMKKIKEK